MEIDVQVRDFDPKSENWNITGIFALEDFNFSTSYKSKYGGIVKLIFLDRDGGFINITEDEAVAIKNGDSIFPKKKGEYLTKETEIEASSIESTVEEVKVEKSGKENLTEGPLNDNLKTKPKPTRGKNYGGSEKNVWN